MATVGIVKELSGIVQAVNSEGSTRVLVLGDAINSDEVIVTVGAGSSAKISFNSGKELALGADEKTLIDESVYAQENFDETDVQAVQQALLEGETLPDEATAAGQDGADDTGGITEAYIADRTDGRGDVDTYNLGTQQLVGANPDGSQNDPNNLAPEPEDDVGVAVEEGAGGEGQYDAPIVAIGNVLDNDYDDGLPNPEGDLDVIDVISNNTTNVLSIDIDGNFVLQGEYGVLVLNPETGAYTYTVDDDNPIVDALNITDTLPESFTYTVSDGDKASTANLDITIEGSNDAPVANEDTTGNNISGLTVVQGEIVASEYTPDYDGEYDVEQDYFEQAVGVTVDKWAFTHSGGDLNIDVLTERGDGSWIDINSDGFQSNLDSMIQLYRVDELGNFIEHIDYDDDGGPGNDGSTHSYDSLLNLIDLPTGYYVLSISDHYFEESEAQQDTQDADNVGVYQITFDGAISITGVPELGQIISASDETSAFVGNNAKEEGAGNEYSDTDEAITTAGNVLNNDTDVDNAHEELSVVDVNGEAVASEGETTIVGEFGTLVIAADGSYMYTVNDENENVEILNEGDIAQDVFTYTVSDNEEFGAKTDTATLTINVEGSNDAPIAYEDNTETDIVVLGSDMFGIGSGAPDLDDQDGESVIDSQEQLLIFGEEYANQSVKISFDADINGGWDGIKFFTLPEVDTFKVFINGERVDLKTYDHGEEGSDFTLENQPFEFVVSLDENGNALLRFEVKSTGVDETVDISNIQGTVLQYVAIEEGVGREAFPEQQEDAINATGNVLMNDTDVDNIDYGNDPINYELSVVALAGDVLTEIPTILSDNYDVDSYDFIINGEYGWLMMSDDGTFKYVIDEGRADFLNEGDYKTETFTYTVSDNNDVNAKIDTAELSVTIQGTNDAPIAFANTASVSEQGAETVIDEDANIVTIEDPNQILFTADGEERNIFGEDVIVDDARSVPMIVKGNLIKYDTDVDNVDASENDYKQLGHDDMTMYSIVSDNTGDSKNFVTEEDVVHDNLIWLDVEKHGELKPEGYLPVEFGAESEYIFATKHGTSIVGEFGTLYIGSNGGYDYIINDSLEAVQALNEGDFKIETFTYVVTDNQEGNVKYDTSTLTITINGTNDAPVANVDEIAKLSDTFFVHQGTGDAWDFDNIDVNSEYGTPVLTGNNTLGVATTTTGSYWWFGWHTYSKADNTNQLDGKGANETIGFDFNKALSSVTVALSHFNELNILPDTATWTVYGTDGSVISGTFTYPASDVSFDIDPGVEFTRLEISANEWYSDFRIKAIDGYGIEENSFVIDKEFLLGNDTDVDNDVLSIGTLSGDDASYLSIDGDGNIVFTPGVDFDETSLTFAYTASDGAAESAPAEVTIDFVEGTISSGEESHTYSLSTGEQVIGSDGYDVLIVPETEVLDLTLVSDIEEINLNGGTHVLDMNAEEVFNATDTNNTLVINGEDSNSFDPTGWTSQGVDSDGYSVFTATFHNPDDVTIKIDADISIII